MTSCENTIKVCCQDGDPVFIFEIHGKLCIENILEIEHMIDENPEYVERGCGTYTFRFSHEADDGWCLDPVGFVSVDDEDTASMHADSNYPEKPESSEVTDD